MLGRYPTGVCIVTAMGPAGRPVGMTVGSFTSVSLDPPLVAFLPAKNSRAFAAIAKAERFAVNVLADDQVAVCQRFASRESDKFRGVSWRASVLGSPLLTDVLAWIDCRLDKVIEVGDHLVVVGSVESLDVERVAPPLVFFQGGYGRFSALSTVAEADLAACLRLAELARPNLERMSANFGVQAAASALAGEQVIQLAWVGAEDAALVGLRLPFVAPFGLVFAAWETESVRDKWFGRHDATVREVLSEDLGRARDQGWTAIPDHGKLREIESSIARLATGGPFPEAIRELDTRIAAFAQEYAARSSARPRGLSVPVFDDTGRVALSLTAQRLPAMDRERLERCRAELVTAGTELTAAIRGASPAG
ncbi:flavin reductase [Amycolatopsis jejuensis]|uniref:flavin reductase n=1 Tax=Amycolatopsis jejuensis TaxID=330084 RepID=UPI002480B194|nr:flavin reductase [Amycolatopsis jejuensis]